MSLGNSLDDGMTEAADTNAALVMPVTHDAMFGRTLPSELWKQVSAPDSSLDAESVVQRILSALAFQEEVSSETKKHNELDIPRWLWKNMASEIEDADPEPTSESANYEWWMAARVLHKVLPQLSPFDIHTVASDSIIFTDGSPSHCCLCILLCAYSLRRCEPPNLEVRWKRWQSIVCETIRMFQHYGIELEAATIPLYMDYVAPSCTHVIQKLPEEAFHSALLSGLIATVTTIVKRECREQEKSQSKANLLAHVLQLMELSRSILDAFGDDERLILLHPWREFHETASGQEKNSKLEYMQRHTELAWWSVNAYRHEKVAGMETLWDPLGVSVLALVAFESRSLVWSTDFIWKMWFPHVLSLFKGTEKVPHLQHVPIILLDNLLQVIPEKSLPESHTSRIKADSPLETFQQLSNRILARPREEEEDTAMDSEMEESVLSTNRIVGLMKELLSKYQPTNQVKLIRQLVHDCPHHGLQAKFMDLLRAVIFEPTAADALWTYVGSFVKDLTAHIDKNQEELIHVETLVQKVEVYVGAVTMIQLWCMVKGKVPPRVRKHSLKDFFKVLKVMMERWMTDSMSVPPDDYYRLYLLEGALEQVIRILDENKMDGSSDHGEGSHHLSSTENNSSGGIDEPQSPEEKKETPPEPVRVSAADADLFGM